MAPKVKVVNETKQDIDLAEGTAGMFVPLMTIPSGKAYHLKVLPNETFRQYQCKLHPKSENKKNQAVFLTSDEFAGLVEIVIKLDSTNTLSYELKKKKESGNNEGSPDGWFSKLISWPRGKKVTTGSGGSGGGGGGDAEMAEVGGVEEEVDLVGASG